MLAPTAYVLSVTAIAVVLGSLVLGATRLRSRLLGGWSGVPARLADAVLTLALLIWTAELIGAVGLLERGPLVLACIAAGLGLRLAVRPPAAGAGELPPAPPPGRWGQTLGALIAAVLLAHWSIGTVAVFGSGMTGYDSAWYHMPFAAHFAQTGSTLDFASVAPRYLSWFYPQNSELLHGVGIVLLQRDVISPLLNLLFLGGSLAAAWCVGRPYGLAPWTLAAVAILLDAGLMADQAGEARNDTLALFFLLATVALLVNGAAAGGRRGPNFGALAVAGTAAGLAAGVKLSFLVPVAALTIGATFLVSSGRRRAAAIWFGTPMVAGCAFWYLRNIAVAGNPFPWFKAVGPLQLDGPEQGLGGRPQFSVLHYVGDGRVWSDWFEPALSDRLGELWPLLFAAVAAAAILCLLRASPILKVIAVAALAWVPIYLLDGTSAEGPAGTPFGFASSLRHLLPSLALALVLVPLLAGQWSRRGRMAVALLLAALLVASDLSGEPWRPGYVVLAAALGALAVSMFLLRTAYRNRTLPRPALALACVAAVGTLIAGGWFLQRSYLSDRYIGHDFRSAGLNAAFAWASKHQEQRIATTFPLQYPLFGTDLSNRVQHLGRRVDDGGFVQPSSCADWINAINRGHFHYLVINDRPGAIDRDSRENLGRIPARLILESKLIEVFRLHGPLDRSACRHIRKEPASRTTVRPTAPGRART
jgi:hypothetical protein